MSKIEKFKFSIKGKSEKIYEFDIYTLDTKFEMIGGVYIFVRLYKDGSHTLVYCGKTEDLSTRFANHHKATCIKKYEANCLCVKIVDRESERVAIEADILNGNNFCCNEVLNT